MLTNPTTYNIPTVSGIVELNGTVYLVNFDNFSIYKNFIFFQRIGNRPFYITSDGFRYLYITDFELCSILKYDTFNDTYISSGRIFNTRPSGICFYNNILYVSLFDSGIISTVNPDNLTLIRSNFITDGSLVPRPQGNVLYNNNLYISSETDHCVFKYDLNGVKDTNFSLTLPAMNPTGITILNNSFIFVSSSNQNVYQFNLDGSLVTPSPFTNTPTVFQLCFANNFLYVASKDTSTAYQYVYNYLPPAPTISNFYIPVKTFGDEPFEIPPPTSNSTGSFTYFSSNTSVATITGNMITIVAVGSSTITARQAETDDFSSGSIIS
jgi:hypothetical protein